VKEIVIARGHPEIRATHKTTLEVTKEKSLTERGDCIIGVGADKSISELSDGFKKALMDSVLVMVEISLPDYGLTELLTGYGSRELTFNHPTDIVIRKSDFICRRTLLIKADKAAIDINREIIELLRDTTTELSMSISPVDKKI
jgi:hypothetical protein